MTKNEKWALLPEYGIAVSDSGEVYKIEQAETGKGAGAIAYRKLQQRLTKPRQSNGNIRYRVVTVGGKECRVHRLVATAFLPNPENKPLVMHLDDNPQNNCVENLQWGTARDNLSTDAHRRNISRALQRDWKRNPRRNQRPYRIMGENVETGERRAFNSQMEAARYIGANRQGNVSRCLLYPKGHPYHLETTRGWKFWRAE